MISLDITSIDFPKWTGAVTQVWQTSGPNNWQLVTAGSAASYTQGDSVLFDSAGGVNRTVEIQGTVTPNTIAVDPAGSSYTFVGAGNISGATPLAITGAGTVTLANGGLNDFSGSISIGASGTLQIGNGGANGSMGAGSIINNGNLVLNRSDTLSVPNGISGSGNVTIRAGSVALSGNNSYDGVTTVESGAVLSATSATALGSAVGGTLVQNGASLVIGAAGNATYAESLTLSGAGNTTITSPGALHLTGTGVVSLSLARLR